MLKTALAHIEPVQGPLPQLLALALIYGAVLAVASVTLLGSAVVALSVFAAITVLAAQGIASAYPHAVLGGCNAVTLARAAMVAFLAGAVVAVDVSGWLLFAVATLAFALDGLDGWLARRARLVSEFGARFDMEVDAGLAAVLAIWLWTSGVTGPEILLLGGMRYLFVAASIIWPALKAPLPPSFRRKAICVVQVGALVLLMFPLTPTLLAMPVAFLAAALLSWSFLIDIRWLTLRSV
ncbi:MAG: CDP-alcohol phosphatidyltransferase family protein [Pseudomonadota bacterium]